MQNIASKVDWANKIQLILFIMTVFLGTMTLYSHKENINKIENEGKLERDEEEERRKFFRLKFPKIAQIPIIGAIIGWIYKEGWQYVTIFVISVLLGFSLRIYGVGDFDFKGDEFLVLNSAASYHFGEGFYIWDWIKSEPTVPYTRAWPHLWLVAKSFDIFSISEWSSRLSSVVFGTILILESYFITKYFTNSKKIALLVSLSFALNPSHIELSRFTRMYIILMPIFFLSAYLFYRGITEKSNLNIKNNFVIKIKDKFCNFNLIFLAVGSILFIISYTIHIISVIIIPVLLIFLIYLFILRFEKKYLTGILILSTGTIIFYFFNYNLINQFITFFDSINFFYILYLAEFPFYSKFPFHLIIGELGLIFLLFSIVIFLLKKEKSSKDKLAYISSFVYFSSIYFVFMAETSLPAPYYRYISHITAFSIILIILSYYYFSQFFKKRVIRSLIIILLLVNISFSFFNSIGELYFKENNFGRYSDAYQKILMDFNQSNDVIFGQYLRTYYLMDLRNDTMTIDMLNFQRYEFRKFLEDLEKSESGWITWETMKTYHIDPKIVDYVCNNFEHIHGQVCGDKIDDTHVEVFYFDKNMLYQDKNMSNIPHRDWKQYVGESK